MVKTCFECLVLSECGVGPSFRFVIAHTLFIDSFLEPVRYLTFHWARENCRMTKGRKSWSKISVMSELCHSQIHIEGKAAKTFLVAHIVRLCHQWKRNFATTIKQIIARLIFIAAQDNQWMKIILTWVIVAGTVQELWSLLTFWSKLCYSLY